MPARDGGLPQLKCDPHGFRLLFLTRSAKLDLGSASCEQDGKCGLFLDGIQSSSACFRFRGVGTGVNGSVCNSDVAETSFRSVWGAGVER